MKKIIFIILNSLTMTVILYSQPVLQWERIFNTIHSNDEAMKVITGKGGIFAAGNLYSYGENSGRSTVGFFQYNSAQMIRRKFFNTTSNSDDYVTGMAYDSSGHYFITGRTTVQGGPPDIFVSKIDTNSNTHWTRVYSGPSGLGDYSRSIAVDGTGNVIITGSIYNASGSTDYLTLKYNSAGVLQWAVTYNGPGNSRDDAQDVTVDAAGNIFITGTSAGTAATDYDFATIKYNSSGAQQWVQRYNGPFYTDFAAAITADNQGNIYVTGNSNGNGSGYDYATVKYTNTGLQLWIQRYNGTGNSHDYPKDIAVDKAGNVIITGSSIGSNYTRDFATVKYNSSGSQQWASRFDGGSEDYANSLIIDYKGNIVVTGTSYSYDEGYNCMVVKYHPAGSLTWNQSYNGSSNSTDILNTVAVDPSGNIYTAGKVTTNDTGPDIVTAKYSYSGSMQWASFYDGSTEFCRFKSMCTDPSGNIFVTGTVIEKKSIATVKYSSSGVLLWSRIFVLNTSYQNNELAKDITADKFGNTYITGCFEDHNSRIALVTLKYDTDGVLLWSTSQAYPQKDVYPAEIALDSFGNTYITGKYQNWDPVHTGFVTVKYNSSGIISWNNFYNNSLTADDAATSISVDAAGYIYVSGNNFITVKYKPSGITEWAHTYDIADPGVDGFTDNGIDPAGNIYVTGLTNIYTNEPGISLVKYNPSGNVLWDSFREITTSHDPKLKIDNSGNIFIGATEDIQTSDFLVLKYHPSGTKLWEANYDFLEDNILKDIAVDNSGNLYVTGITKNSVTDGFNTVKFNSAGVRLWDVFHSGAPDKLTSAPVDGSISLDNVGNVYVGFSKITSPVNYYATSFMTLKYSQTGNMPLLSGNINSKLNNELPKEFRLHNNFPNPFNPSTEIKLELPVKSMVSLNVYDITGRLVQTIINETKPAGYYSFSFDGSNLASGVYFYRITADGNGLSFSRTLKMILVK